jgi:hypothetical protein
MVFGLAGVLAALVLLKLAHIRAPFPAVCLSVAAGGALFQPLLLAPSLPTVFAQADAVALLPVLTAALLAYVPLPLAAWFAIRDTARDKGTRAALGAGLSALILPIYALAGLAVPQLGGDLYPALMLSVESGYIHGDAAGVVQAILLGSLAFTPALIPIFLWRGAQARFLDDTAKPVKLSPVAGFLSLFLGAFLPGGYAADNLTRSFLAFDGDVGDWVVGTEASFAAGSYLFVIALVTAFVLLEPLLGFSRSNAWRLIAARLGMLAAATALSNLLGPTFEAGGRELAIATVFLTVGLIFTAMRLGFGPGPGLNRRQAAALMMMDDD